MKETYIECIINTGKIQNFILKDELENVNIFNMRKFHNYIKNELIINSCKSIKAEKLLDIACGRGGDIIKWIKSDLKFVFAFDVHKESIYCNDGDCAISRFNDIKKNYKSKNKKPFTRFYNLNILDKDILSKIKYNENKINIPNFNGKYDVVSCQFAFHYFSKNDDDLNHLFNVISNKLKVNGLFIGTTTDGDKIKKILEIGDVNIPLLTLIKKDNNSYLFDINSDDNKRKHYFELQGVSLEYYVIKEKLINIAEKYGLKMIEIKSFYDWYLNSDKSIKLSSYEMIISFLNFSFIFQKIK